METDRDKISISCVTHPADLKRKKQGYTVHGLQEWTDETANGVALKSFRHSTMGERRNTTSCDESLGYGGGQQSLYHVTKLLSMSFATRHLMIIFFLTMPWKTMQVKRNIMNHNTMGTKSAFSSPGVPYTCTTIHIIQHYNTKWFMSAWVNIGLHMAHLSNNQIRIKTFNSTILILLSKTHIG